MLGQRPPVLPLQPGQQPPQIRPDPATRLSPGEPARDQLHHRIQRRDPPSKIHHTVIITARRISPSHDTPTAVAVLGAFTERTALDYLDSSQVAAGLSSVEKLKLVRLTRGSPLWLAFAVAHLDARGMPEEAEVEFEVIDRTVPYGADPTPEGQRRLEDFRSRLAAPYRATDFWHEAEKRLAVVRQGVNRQIWQRLMDDLPLPHGVADLDEAWRLLLKRPWIRSRANERYVTLHDAVAEELAQRVIPLHDQDEQWRRTHWVRAIIIYGEQIEGPEAELIEGMARLDGKLLAVETGTDRAGESELVAEAAQLDSRMREIDRFKAARLYYRLLHDFDEGCREFLELFGRAKQEHDVLLQGLLAQEMQRFLPGGAHPYVFDDAVGKVISAFREWLSRHPELYTRIGVSLGEYLVDNEQSAAAIELLGRLPRADSDVRQQFRISILLGNAYMRTPGSVRSGLEHFRRALTLAGSENDPTEQQKLLAEAYKELGYYYRNNGLWGTRTRRISGPGTRSRPSCPCGARTRTAKRWPRSRPTGPTSKGSAAITATASNSRRAPSTSGNA